jgi:hypothetical protein
MRTRKTRNVSLTPELEAVVDSKVASGRYRSASEVVRPPCGSSMSANGAWSGGCKPREIPSMHDRRPSGVTRPH